METTVSKLTMPAPIILSTRIGHLKAFPIFSSHYSASETLLVEVASVLAGTEFVTLIRSISLQSNSNLCPYDAAEIALCSLDIKTLSPLSKYVLEENISYLDQMRRELLTSGLDIFQLQGRVEISRRGKRNFLAPPVIEEWPHEGRLIIDGLHRMFLARRYGIESIACVLIRNVSLPPVPLPVDWNDIRKYSAGNYPQDKQDKRAYRFNDFSEVVSLEKAKDWGITPANFDYFFYRDLSCLGSGGIRDFPQSEEGRGSA